MKSFVERVAETSRKNQTLLCVGLDPDPTMFPASMKGDRSKIFDFCREIVDATADMVCAFKPQIAYFSAFGAEAALKNLIQYIHERHPGIPVLLDAKRGDIGSTSEMYAREAFDYYEADAVTVNPYLGTDSLTPFLERKEKGVVVLCRTSNPGARTFQDLEVVKGRKLYQVVAERAVNEWNSNQNVMIVVGATYPRELKEIRDIAPDMTFLVPGLGAQGAQAKDIIENGAKRDGGGLIVNSARAVIYAGHGHDFADKARQQAQRHRDELNLGVH